MIAAQVKQEVIKYDSIEDGMYLCKTYAGNKALFMKEGLKYSIIFNDGSFSVREYEQHYWETLHFVMCIKIKQGDEIDLTIECNP